MQTVYTSRARSHIWSSKTMPVALTVASPLLLAAFGVVLQSGCGSNKGDGSTGGQTGACEAICDKQDTCIDIDVSECVEECAQQRAYSADYFDAARTCYENMHCSEVSSELNECIEDELHGAKLSGAASAFCDEYAAKWSDCDASVDDADVQEECEKEAPLLSDSYLGSLKDCLAESCDSVGGCFDEEADQADSSVVPPFSAEPGPNECAHQCVEHICASESSQCNETSGCVAFIQCLDTWCSSNPNCVDVCAAKYTEEAVVAAAGLMTCVTDECDCD